MKKFISPILLYSLLLFSVNLLSQIQVQSSPASGNIIAENPFFDASSYDLSLDASSAGKGLVFPRTDLTTWAFNIANLYSGSPYFITAFDGMIVYNSGTGNSATGGNNPSTATAVTPGFYYFSNPNGATNGNVTSGVWTPLGGDASTKNITSSETTLLTKINGAQLYSISGTFTASGTSTYVTVTIPDGMTGYSSLVTYKDGKKFRTEINFFDTSAITDNVITGNGNYSEVYPAGTYTYVLEYFK